MQMAAINNIDIEISERHETINSTLFYLTIPNSYMLNSMHAEVLKLSGS